jgi:hypothetical protein
MPFHNFLFLYISSFIFMNVLTLFFLVFLMASKNNV